jgi:hypothetical protein
MLQPAWIKLEKGRQHALYDASSPWCAQTHDQDSIAISSTALEFQEQHFLGHE